VISVMPVTGEVVDTSEPDGGIALADIAHCLALINRWHGSTLEFYSVAQHCVLGLQFCTTDEIRRCFLLHEGGEVACGDIASPLRTASYDRTEGRVLRAVAERYELPWPLPDEVFVIDKRMAATERDQLLHPSARKHIALEAKPYRKLKIEPWTPARSRREWILAAARLGLE
jgi:hypothetical protein